MFAPAWNRWAATWGTHSWELDCQGRFWVQKSTQKSAQRTILLKKVLLKWLKKVNSLRKVNLLKKVAQKSLFYAKVTQKSDKYSKKEITHTRLLVEQLPTLLDSQAHHLNINRKSTSLYKIFCRDHLLDLPQLLPLVANLILHNGDFLAETDRLLRLHLLKGKFTKKFFSEPSQPAPESSS